MAFPPEAFLIGAQKAGTTSLAYLLEQHPKIALSEPKEPDYFTRYYSRGIDWYRSCFPDPNASICLDASTSYTMLPLHEHVRATDPLVGVPERMYKCNPDARFIYILRNPVLRTYSSYWHSVRNGEESRPFREAISDTEECYIWASDYCAQIENYLQHYPLESFCFLSFKELITNPSAVTKKCFEFLGVDASVKIDMRGKVNPSYTYTAFGKLITKIVPSQSTLRSLFALARALIPDNLEASVRGLITNPIAKMEASDQAYLEDYFRDRNKAFEKLTGICVDEC